jgi:hypothetical protein
MSIARRPVAPRVAVRNVAEKLAQRVRLGLGRRPIVRIGAVPSLQGVVIVSSALGTADALFRLKGNGGSAFQTDRSAQNEKEKSRTGKSTKGRQADYRETLKVIDRDDKNRRQRP